MHVPSFATLDDGTCILPGGAPTEALLSVSLGFDFDLEDGKWFAVDGGSVVRFPISKEWDWRTRTSMEIVKAAQIIPAEQRISELECAAGLCNMDLQTLMKKVSEVRTSGESLEEALKKVFRK
jgi:uncharacterized coiled-coil protein SlyX